MKAKKNILLIGACGGVGRAFLRMLLRERERWGEIVLVDKQDPWADDRVFPFRKLKGEFLKATIDVAEGGEDYLRLLKPTGSTSSSISASTKLGPCLPQRTKQGSAMSTRGWRTGREKTSPKWFLTWSTARRTLGTFPHSLQRDESRGRQYVGQESHRDARCAGEHCSL